MVAQSITLQTSDSGIVASEVLGRISFAASNESSGSDAILIGASVYARADAEFTATENPTSIVLATSSTGAVTDRIIVDNSGNLKPATDITYNLGSDTLRFSNLYAFNSNTDLIGAIKIGCKNNTASTISAGIPVYISGHFANGKVYIDIARADTSSKMPAIGILSSGLDPASEGDVYIFGTVQGLNTNGFTVGSTLFVAPTGGFTSTKPTGVSELIQNMGRVARADTNNGRIILLGPGRTNDIPNSGNFQQLSVGGTGVVVGSGTGGRVTFWGTNGNNILDDYSEFVWDSLNNRLGLNTASPSTTLHVNGDTYTSDIIINNQTANTILSLNGSKFVTSLSTTTYPSLTELSYVKGVTSAIQTQLGNKAETSTTITAGSGLAGGGSLAANRTIDVGQGDGITVSADSIAVDSTVVRTTGIQTVPGAKTFQSSTTFLSGVTISNQTASTIASFDASKNVTSLSTATYPTLTELSYVKGVTSAIQTQIDSKASTSHTHTASNITDFQSAVSGLLPVKNIVAGTNVTVSSSNGTYTINSTASGGGGGATVENSGDNRVLTSTGSTSGINAEGNLTFNGSVLNVTGSGLVASGLSVSGSLTVSNTGVFSSGITINSQTASTIASFDANKNIVSLATATYPTLTELSYVKGVTSALQTQIDGKVATSDTTVVRTTGTQVIPGAKTFQSSTVFSSGVNIDNQTASTIASFDASKNVTSLSTATYPSLTELSYVKGVTSAIQTQLNTKTSMTAATSGDNRVLTSDGSVTGIVGEGNLTFNGSVLNVTGSGLVASGLAVSGSLTVSNTGVFSSGVTINNQTASTIASFDANKNVVSLATATYPTLTELSYVKGVTSAIQTQIDSKAATTTTIAAGSGLVHGGSLSTNRTLDVGQGDGISVTADAIAVDSTVVRTTGTQTITGDKTFGNLTATSGIITNYVGTIDTPAGGRLTLTTGSPFPSGDVSAATNIYYSPYVSNKIALYDSTNTRWQLHTFSEVTLALGTLTSGKNYDVFFYDNAGTKTMEAVAWTSDSARATAIVQQDGVYVKSGTPARRYVGTFRTTSTTTTEDSVTKRFLWNMYNKETEILFTNPGYNNNATTTSYTLTGTSVTALNGGTGSKTEMVCGLRTVVHMSVKFAAALSASAGVVVGIAIDQTTNPDGPTVGAAASADPRGVSAVKTALLEAGYHAFNLVGKNNLSATSTIYADLASSFSGTTDMVGTSMEQIYLG